PQRRSGQDVGSADEREQDDETGHGGGPQGADTWWLSDEDSDAESGEHEQERQDGRDVSIGEPEVLPRVASGVRRVHDSGPDDRRYQQPAAGCISPTADDSQNGERHWGDKRRNEEVAVRLEAPLEPRLERDAPEFQVVGVREGVAVV